MRVRLMPHDSEKPFELLSGYERWIICKEEGLSLLTIVEQATSAQALLLRYLDNTGVPISGYDQGRQIVKALERKDFDSQADIARLFGRDEGWVSKLIALARLPKEVVDAFTTPADVQHLPKLS